MTTALILGPADHGRPMTLREFESAPAREGYRYEIIDGKGSVSPVPNLPHEILCTWIKNLLDDYAREHPEVINFISTKPRVVIPEREEETSPEPDLATYHDFPLDRPLKELAWEEVSPILVVEVVSEDDPDKDLVRNVELYLEVPSIREYWILDPRRDPDAPSFLVYRRRGQHWQRVIEIAPGE